MKKTRLLEIIREEIDTAINEVPYPDGPLDIKTSSDISIDPKDRKQKPLQDAIKKATDILKSEYPDMSSESIARLITKVNTPSSRKPGKDLTIKVEDGSKFTLPADSQVGKDFKNALDLIGDAIKKQEDIFSTSTKVDDLMNRKGVSPSTIKRLINLKDKGYNHLLQFPQTLKAVERALKENTTKNPPLSEKELSDKEKHKEAGKAAGTDKTAKDLAKQTDVELAKQKEKEAVKDFMDKMKKEGVIGDDNKVLDAKKYKEEFAKFKEELK
jgi:hypothetical protein